MSEDTNRPLLYNDTTIPVTSKQGVMNDVYTKVADEYDFGVDIITLYMNRVWKTKFVRFIQPVPGERTIDMAAGTCQITTRYMDYQDNVNHDAESAIHVVDFNEGMLYAGKQRLAGSKWIKDGRVTFAKGDAEDLKEIPDNSYDLYIVSAGLHNLPHPEKALGEAYRILKPGGRFACLEYGHSDWKLLELMGDWWGKYVVPIILRMWSIDPASYDHLTRSARAFPDQRTLAKAIRDAGFELPSGGGYTNFNGGMMAAFVGNKPR